mmetsp:Transcript_17154/g.25993  ORF Transcript_17154/g.25993 Transcript_17154/m.25993 type:complete len:85 (-) Transcript_17154:856-1110(-)
MIEMTMSVLTLYRSLLREAKTVSDYNFRSYALRRIKAGFNKNRQLQGEEITSALCEGQNQLEMLKRQSMLTRMYPSATSVMEKV